MIAMKFGLSEKAIGKIKRVFASFPAVEKVVLYGSRAKGNFKNGSDIDLVLIGNEITPKMVLQIGHQLDELLLPHKIDLSRLEQISDPDLLDHIQRVGVVFYQKEN